MNNQDNQPKIKLCECGCGNTVTKSNNKFLWGHNTRSKENKEKFKLTCLSRYGVECPNQSKEIKEKQKNTCLKNYGVDNVAKIQETKDKIKQICIKHYGVDNPMKVDTIKEKYKQTHQIRFGVDYPGQSKMVQLKSRFTSFKRFGVEYAMQSEKIQQKHKNTMVERHGVEYPIQSKEIEDKIKCSCLDKYGSEYHSQSKQGRLKLRIHAIERCEQQTILGEPSQPCIGVQERPFLNELQKHSEYKIIRNDPSFRYVVGRYPDGHILELKLFIQFDEKEHFLDKDCLIYREDDIRCTKDLESVSGYQVFRVSEKRWKENQEDVINEFKIIINNLKQKELNETS